eukprot:TRINITY_DN1517_c0_g1_i5.p1 TRINITY_DN1517_c0_g1~~TRINITY_DN1517_c0_g1_i5.p1  ORF type:complete len:482 (+),score=106.36 TRINITY_DN1517_c0_g1_i5:353-1798(+)
MRCIFVALFLCFFLSLSYAASSDTLMTECTPTTDYIACDATLASTQRVRREVRELSTTEWQAVVDAMWIMKTTSQEDGEALYGSSFKIHDYFVTKHAVAFTDTRGDQAHFGAHFITWHGGFVLEFENCLLAIDPSIGALPYWDQTITSPSVFNDEYFGFDPDQSTDFQVVTGKFANWPVTANFDLSQFDSYIDYTYQGYATPSSGHLRSAVNTLSNPNVTRYGSGEDVENFGRYKEDEWLACTTDSTYLIWNDWNGCLGSFHGGPHADVGGTVGTEIGDFEDSTTSPNGPLFMFHHANMERSKFMWMQNQAVSKCEYFGFPVVDAATLGPGPRESPGHEGMNLNEISSQTWPFYKDELDLDSSAPSTALTHADLICWLTPATAPYTYASVAGSETPAPTPSPTISSSPSSPPLSPSPSPSPSPPPTLSPSPPLSPTQTDSTAPAASSVTSSAPGGLQFVLCAIAVGYIHLNAAVGAPTYLT